jgi:hypothetical protein
MLRSRLSFLGLTLLLALLAACSSPVSPSSPEGGASGQGKPVRPSNFRVTKNDSGFLLQWDAVAGATGYKLQRTGAGGAVNPSQPSFLEQDPSVKVGDKVEYSVWAKNGSILSDALTVTVTMPSSGTTTPPQPASLSKPANLRASAVSGGFLIQWDAVSGATGYKFQRTGGGVVNTTQPSYTETNAKAGDKIEYSVWATNGSVTSAALVATLTMPGASAPPPSSTPPSSGLVTTTYQSSDTVFPNPERGFHDNVPFPFPTSWNLSDPNLFKWIHDRDGSITILRGMVRLDDYRSSSIDSAFLSRLNDSFARVRQEGFKVMLRFMYNYDSSGNDATLSTVLNHISQLKPVLQNNADVIVSMQAGFIGAWGEWHSSQNGLDSLSNKGTILNAILGALPTNRMVQIRYPLDAMRLYPSALSASQAFGGSYQSRVGSHIDCFLNSDMDGGSWDGLGQFSSSQMQSYIQQSSQYTPMSGETCEGFSSSSRGECSVAMSEFQKYHFDMFNNSYYAGGGNWTAGDNPRWVNGGCIDSIKRKLGYRFQLTQSQMSGQVKPGGEFYLSFTVNNVGWGKLFNPRKLEVILRHKASGKVYRLTTGADPRTWLSGSTTTVTVSGGVPASAPTGDYDVLLNLPDPSGQLYGNPAFSIRLANQNVWESSTGFNSLLRTVNVNAAASGNAYSGSSWFQ